MQFSRINDEPFESKEKRNYQSYTFFRFYRLADNAKKKKSDINENCSSSLYATLKWTIFGKWDIIYVSTMAKWTDNEH